MTKRLYAIDFDRTIGNTELFFERLLDITHESAAELKIAVEASADSFDVIRFLQTRHTDDEIHLFMQEFISAPDTRYLLPGTSDLFDFIQSIGGDVIIMTYGSEVWQRSKIIASGLHDDIEVIVTSDPRKAEIISTWKTEYGYKVPQLQSINEVYEEVILLDDKATAFNAISENIIGYWVQSGKPLAIQSGVVGKSVLHVDTLYDVIDCETQRVAS